jgi:L-iditol 2-dehydrogenase
MKACVLHGIGDLRREDVAKSVPKAGEALIAVRACGVCGSDIPRVFSKGTYHFPTIPGHEFAGEVMDVAPGADKSLIGKRVAVFPLIPCRKCPSCEIGAYAQCSDYDYLGSRSDGAFAEYVCAPVWNLLPAPDAVSFAEAAMVEPAAVAAHALRRAGIDIGDVVLIFGAGPIGVMLAMWALIWGAGETLLADVDERKLEFARSLGFSRLVNPIKDDVAGWLREIAPRGADVVIEASGSAAAFEQCMTSARAFGKVVLMGNPVDEMRLSQKAYWAILRNELQVFGTWNSSFSNLPKNEWALSLDWMASGRLDVKPLISHRVSLDELSDALVMMRDRTAFFNKVICEPRGV